MYLFRNFTAALSAVLAATGIANPAVAQDFSPPAIDVLSPQLNAIEFGRQNEQSADAARGESYDGDGFAMPSIGGNLASGLVAPVRSGSTAQSFDTSYRFDRSRTKRNFATFIERTSNPESKAEIKRILAAQPGIMEELNTALAPYGLDTHDVADAYAFWWINAWLVANKRDEDPSPGTIAMVKRQVRDAFAASPDFAKISDAQRQEYAEALLLQSTMLASAFEQWQGDADLLDQLAVAARKGAKASGLDLSLMTLTPNGFMPREGADSSDAEGADDVQLAVDGEGDSSMALALAAGAGLGAVLLGGAVMMRRHG